MALALQHVPVARHECGPCSSRKLRKRPSMKRLIAGAFVALLVSGLPVASWAKDAGKLSKQDFRTAMRKLWEDHVTYTRNYIISAVADLEDADAVAKRLLENQDEIGDAIKPYYGSEAGDQLTKLLREHITIATEVVKAAKAGEKDALTAAQDKWNANGKSIAAFLAHANPNWSQANLES